MADDVMSKIEAMQRRMLTTAGARRRAIDAGHKRGAAVAAPATDAEPSAAEPSGAEPSAAAPDEPPPSAPAES